MRTGIDIPVRFRYNEDTAIKGVMIMKFIDYDRVALTDGFWKEVRSRNAAVSLKNVYRRFAETGRFSAVACVRREDPPHIFYDSDVAKWLEAAAYLQKDYPDAEIRAIIDETVDTIARSQLACGYFNSYYQVYKPDKIFTERTEHELYCAGHLIEAAVALDACGVNGKLLAVMKKYAEYIYDRFYVKRDTGFTTCGHPEIELALVRLYTHTGERKWLTLAQFFIDERGKRAEEIYPTVDRTYDQSHKPVREQTEAVGHAVRALYLYIAMADVGRLTGDDTLVQVCETLFQDIVNKKMYITGGTGSSNVGERFTIAYDLPNQTAYSETCSAIALAFFAERMARIGNKAAARRALSAHSGTRRSVRLFVLSAQSHPAVRADRRVRLWGRGRRPVRSSVHLFARICLRVRVIRTIGDAVQREGDDRRQGQREDRAPHSRMAERRLVCGERRVLRSRDEG